MDLHIIYLLVIHSSFFYISDILLLCARMYQNYCFGNSFTKRSSKNSYRTQK